MSIISPRVAFRTLGLTINDYNAGQASNLSLSTDRRSTAFQTGRTTGLRHIGYGILLHLFKK